MKRLIVNADDFGMSAGVNAGIIRTAERGIVTSASLMVRWPCARAAADYARAYPSLSVGLHIDLGEWAYRDGAWLPLYAVTDVDSAALVEAEVLRQLEMFRELTGRDPTHLDSHQHAHRSPPADRIVDTLGARLGVPIRHRRPVHYEGSFYGQGGKGEPFGDAITVTYLGEILRALPEGVTELACHPGIGTDMGGMYVLERAQEVETLCDPRTRQAVTDAAVELISFHDVRRAG